MNKYKVLLHGCNFWMKMEGKAKLMGFYTTRFVEAETPKKGEDLAVDVVKKDNALREVIVNKKSDPPMIYVEEMTVLKSFKGIKVPGAGYTFFEEKGTENG